MTVSSGNNFEVLYEREPGRFVIAVICPPAGFGDLLEILKKELFQCINILRYEEVTGIDGLLETSIEYIPGVELIPLFIFGTNDYLLASSGQEMEIVRSRLQPVRT